MIRFFIALLACALLLYGSVILGASQGYFQKPTFFLQTLIFVSFTTAVIFSYLYQANKPGFFVQLYLFTMLLKVLAYLVFNFVIISYDKSSAVGNVVFFMITYFCFTALEIVLLYFKISRSDKA